MSGSVIDLIDQDSDTSLETDTETTISDHISGIDIHDIQNQAAIVEHAQQLNSALYESLAIHTFPTADRSQRIRHPLPSSRYADEFSASISRTVSPETLPQVISGDSSSRSATIVNTSAQDSVKSQFRNLKRAHLGDQHDTISAVRPPTSRSPPQPRMYKKQKKSGWCHSLGSPTKQVEDKSKSQHEQRSVNPCDYIVLDEDEEPGHPTKEYQELQRKRKSKDAKRSNSTPKISTSIDVISDDEGENVNDNAPFSKLPTSLKDNDEIQIVNVVTRRSDHTSSDLEEIQLVSNKHCKCEPGMCVEFYNGDFIRISRVTEDRDKVRWVVGELLLRHNEFKDAKWPRRHNEVVHIVKIKKGQSTEWARKPLKQVWRNRTLIFTNQSFPDMSWKTHPKSYNHVQTDIERGPLFCRWRQTHVVDQAGKIIEESIERISFTDADPGARTFHADIRLKWRGNPTLPGGEHKSFKPHETESGLRLVEVQQYTFGDTFCGGGGASCGAEQAGLYVKFGVDLNPKAMQTYKLNFAHKGTECLLKDVHDFIAECVPGQYMVDVLHISPPCQPFSPAHTVPNMTRDEMNQACMFACGELISILKPRVVTLEETYGLFNRHQVWFNALVKMFLDCGYSVRWTGAKLEQYGLPQKRRRLLMIAAGPGEALPPLPEITHSEVQSGNLKPLATIHDVINNIPTGPSISHHDIAAARYDRSQWKIPYSAQTQAKTITCSGGIGNYHPSGKRNFTNRELAALQKFPLTYKFADCNITDLRRQIGNAVPPLVFKKIYREIINSLKKTDGIV